MLQLLLRNGHSFLELCPGSGKLILNDPAWDPACGELSMSRPQVSCLGQGGCSTRIPGATALGCGSTKVSRGICPTRGLIGSVKGLKWSSSECLIFLFAVSMQVSPGGSEQGEAPAQAVPGVPRQGRAGSGMLLPKCCHRGSCWALGPEGSPLLSPPTTSVWDPPSQTLLSSTEHGGARGAPPTQKSPRF